MSTLMNVLDEHIYAHQIIEKLFIKLHPREERVIRLRFGLDGIGEHTYQEIADDWRLSKDRIRQIEQKALRRLQARTRRERLDLAPRPKYVPPPSQKLVPQRNLAERLRAFDAFLKARNLILFAGPHGPALRRDVPIEGLCLSDLIALELSRSEERKIRDEFAKRFVARFYVPRSTRFSRASCGAMDA